MRRSDLGDVVVRARGLANHLLDRITLLQLARSAGIGALARALENVGYWPAPAAGDAARSAERLVARSIEHEIGSRLGVLVRWLAGRVGLFTPVFELELRDALRIRLRELSARDGPRSAVATPSHAGWPALRDLRNAIARARDLPELVRALARLGSPYAPPLAAALRNGHGDPSAVEAALDHTWATRARHCAGRVGGPLKAWVEDEIDLHNAWGALVGEGGSFVEGGAHLSRERQQAIASTGDGTQRRRLLALALAAGSLAGVFEHPGPGIASLEARARAARIAAARRSARRDPIGASPILEVVLRLWTERADLRCISWGVATGLSYETIVAGLATTP